MYAQEARARRTDPAHREEKYSLASSGSRVTSDLRLSAVHPAAKARLVPENTPHQAACLTLKAFGSIVS